MSSIAIVSTDAKTSSGKKLVNLFSDKCRGMSRSTEPGDKAFVGYLRDLVKNRNGTATIGKFSVFENVDGDRRIIFVVPKVRGSNAEYPSQNISIRAVPQAAINLICDECGASSFEIVFDISVTGVQVVKTMGRVNSQSSLGRLVEVLG